MCEQKGTRLRFAESLQCCGKSAHANLHSFSVFNHVSGVTRLAFSVLSDDVK